MLFSRFNVLTLSRFVLLDQVREMSEMNVELQAMLSSQQQQISSLSDFVSAVEYSISKSNPVFPSAEASLMTLSTQSLPLSLSLSSNSSRIIALSPLDHQLRKLFLQVSFSTEALDQSLGEFD